MNQSEYISLKVNGWTEFRSGSSDTELISIALKIGNILKHPNGQNVFTLKPKLEYEAIKGTFSNRYGLNDFPLHTDTAFFERPARYILMHSIKANGCDTTILSKINFWDSLTQSDKKKAERAVYLIKTNCAKFYTSFLFQENGTRGIKYDPSCMFPANKYAKEFDLKFQEILSKTKPLSLKWTDGKTIIIDNWINLHGRKSAKKDINRQLKRIYID